MTTVNNNYYRFSVKPEDTFLNIPVEITFDMAGRNDGILEFEKDILQDLINGIDDFETTRFANSEYTQLPNKTDINYEFNFLDSNVQVTAATASDWSINYNNATFTDSEIYYFANSFKGSFFKLDFYDTKTNENQKAYFSVIIPTQQGLTKVGYLGPLNNQTQVNVKKPKFKLDYIGADKEGFFIYWLKERDFININEFYMTAKFFNAKIGQFVRFMNEPQSSFSANNKFNFDKSQYFYYKVELDYINYEYKVYKEIPQQNQTPTLQRVGDSVNVIKWYEYGNP
jgi:hypothetical protein